MDLIVSVPNISFESCFFVQEASQAKFLTINQLMRRGCILVSGCLYCQTKSLLAYIALLCWNLSTLRFSFSHFENFLGFVLFNIGFLFSWQVVLLRKGRGKYKKLFPYTCFGTTGWCNWKFLEWLELSMLWLKALFLGDHILESCALRAASARQSSSNSFFSTNLGIWRYFEMLTFFASEKSGWSAGSCTNL